MLSGRLAVCRFSPDEPVPVWALAGPLSGATRTPAELSVFGPEASVPAGVRAERGFRALRVAGRLDFSLTGILASLCGPLAEAGVSVFAFSTFDTDYLLVREEHLERALAALSGAGHRVPAG